MKNPGKEIVYAVVPTYRRDEYLRTYIEACMDQTRPVQKIVVVDNGGSDNTAKLCAEFDAAKYIRSEGNIGPWAAHAAGMQLALDDGADVTWNSDDDSAPVPDALEKLLVALRANEDCGAIGSGGGTFSLYPKHWRRGKANGTLLDEANRVWCAGFLELDGTAWQTSMIKQIGVPRTDFFMGMGGIEYSLRAQKHGFKLGLIDEELTNRLHLGSGGTGAPGAPWRSYYQTRNHLAMAIEFRSPKLLLGWAIRQALVVTGNMIQGQPPRMERLLWRARGTRDALLGRMGNRVDPTTYHKSKYI